MDPAVLAEIEGLQRLKTRALRTKYQEVFGAPSHSSHKQFLVRRIAWRLQARAEGGLSERARRRAAEIADDADLRLCAPRELNPLRRADIDPARLGRTRSPKDGRLPPAGTISPENIGASRSSSKSWKTALSIRPASTVPSA